ncbi:MAG: endolytic transglycosylase MltG [Helicobacteraceae bacterium]|nr:endolytic transglycosylase MltG [Helicobacteraceae bacterium]
MSKKAILLYIFFNLILFCFISIFYYLSLNASYPSVINVPKGSIDEIITHFKQNKLDINKLDSFLIRFLGSPQSGWIEIKPTDKISQNTSKGSFLYQLTNSKAALKELKLIPGETMHFFIEDISNTLGLDKKDLWDSYNEFAKYPDGVILPNTYKVPLDIGPRYLMSHLISLSIKEHKKNAIKILGRYDEKQWFNYVTIASIVQKESASKDEMPLVAAVIYNRLKAKMPLQMDGSLNYGEYSHQKVTPQRIRNDKSVYNTYLNKGIPPYPVGSASMDAIIATIRPANVDYLYFVKNSSGKHSFSNSYDEHLKNIR